MDNLQLQKINLVFNDAHKFIEALTGDFDSICDFRVIKAGSPTHNLHGTIINLEPQLKQLNESGYNIFITVNQSNGKGVKASNINAIRSFVLDFDNAEADNLKVINSLPLTPSITVETSPNKFHAWFILNENDPRTELFKPIQKALATKYDADINVCDLPRVMRLPNFYHRKSTPFLSKIISDSGKYFTIENIIECFNLDVSTNNTPQVVVPSKNGTGEYFDSDINKKQYIRHLTNIIESGEHIPREGINGNSAIVKHIAPWARDYGLTIEVAEELIWTHLNPHCEPPWTETERPQLLSFIEQGYKASKNGLGCLARKPITNIFRPVPVPQGGWEAHQKHWEERNKTNIIVPLFTDAARVLASAIECSINKQSGITIAVQISTIEKIITSSFYSPQKNAVYLLNNKDDLIEAKGKDIWRFLTKTFGQVLDIDAFTDSIDLKIESEKLSKVEGQRFLTQILSIPSNMITEHIRYVNQRSSIGVTVDMFAEHGRIEINDEIAKVVFKHIPLTSHNYDQLIIDDYKHHYPNFDSFIEWIVNCRFAGDRKLGYMWLHADSDWGKGFLISVISDHKLSVELHIKEVEKMFEGAPVGRSMNDFKRCIVLIIDEFKSVKSELKQLQNQMTISPKNQLAVKVDLYAKLFTSAEHVHSLVGDAGIENQFANRFNYFRYSGSINSRDLFNKVGKFEYLNNVKNYFAERFNILTSSLIKLGKDTSAKQADDYLKKFHDANGIGNNFSLLSDSLKELADDVVEHIITNYNQYELVPDGKKIYLKKPSKCISDFIKMRFDDSESFTLIKKKDQIRDLMCVDGTTYTTHRIGLDLIKGIRIE